MFNDIRFIAYEVIKPAGLKPVLELFLEFTLD